MTSTYTIHLSNST